MKKTILALISFLILSLQDTAAQNFFQEGTVWEGCGYDLGNPDPWEWKASLFRIHSIEGYEATPFAQYDHATQSWQKPEIYVRAEGEKVYWWPVKVADPSLEKWHLLYDFGLQPGERAEITIPTLTDEKGALAQVHSDIVECKATNIEKKGWYGTFMEVVVIFDSGEESDAGVWGKGIGSTYGPLHPLDFATAGGSAIGLEKVVTSDGVIVYGKKDTPQEEINYFKAGTTWTGTTLGSISDSPDKVGHWQTKLLEPIAFDNYEVLPYVDIDSETGATGKPLAYIRTEGAKVYWYPADSENSEYSKWHLLYDFGLMPGEETYVSFPLALGTDLLKVDTLHIKCLNTNVGREGLTGSYMEIGIIYDEPGYIPTGWWCMGVGSLSDPMMSADFDLIPNNSNVRRVTDAEGTVIYGSLASVKTPEKVNITIQTEGNTIRIAGLNSSTPVSVYDMNGKVIATGRGNCEFTLSTSNIYVVKAGSITQMIIL